MVFAKNTMTKTKVAYKSIIEKYFVILYYVQRGESQVKLLSSHIHESLQQKIFYIFKHPQFKEVSVIYNHNVVIPNKRVCKNCDKNITLTNTCSCGFE